MVLVPTDTLKEPGSRFSQEICKLLFVIEIESVLNDGIHSFKVSVLLLPTGKQESKADCLRNY